jgi:UDP-N-acetylmuramate dehydrogenase
MSAGELKFGYRTSSIKNRDILVIEAGFRFIEGNSREIEQVRGDILSRRASKQPLEYPNCGSVFKRPPGNYAGTLIEQCGLKGYRSGNIEISDKHANFIINKGGGTASDVRRVIWKVQKEVYEKSGILLEPEVVFVGEFDVPLFET